MSLSTLQSDSPADIEVTLVLAQQASGRVTASVMEFPSCHVEAETRETAIADLKILLARRLQNVEMVPIKISLSRLLILGVSYLVSSKIANILMRLWKSFNQSEKNLAMKRLSQAFTCQKHWISDAVHS
jgi:hypothetical protein